MKGRNTRALGRAGEDLAERHLIGAGFRILARNVHLRHAELDLVALDRTTLVFVEVRLRRSARFGSGEESVDRRKQRRIAAAAAELLARGRLPRAARIRFDVVAIDAATDAFAAE
jgi:putative endonuclease